MLSLSLSALAMVESRESDLEPGASPAGDSGAGAEPAPAEPRRAAAADAPPDRAREFLMQHLARFYDFKGLFRWKSRFDPCFEDRYLVYPGPFALPRVALALIRAQSPAGLLSYLQRPSTAAGPTPDPDQP